MVAFHKASAIFKLMIVVTVFIYNKGDFLMAIKKVTVAGSGVLGSQIAFQSAFKGFDVTVYDINQEAVDKAAERIKGCAMLTELILTQLTRNLTRGLDDCASPTT